MTSKNIYYKKLC